MFTASVRQAEFDTSKVAPQLSRVIPAKVVQARLASLLQEVRQQVMVRPSEGSTTL